MHDECTIFNIFADAQETQIAYTTLSDKPIVILYHYRDCRKRLMFIIIIQQSTNSVRPW